MEVAKLKGIKKKLKVANPGYGVFFSYGFREIRTVHFLHVY